MLLGRWNDAIGALMDQAPEFRVDAIHMGICLWAMGKIDPSPSLAATASKWLFGFEGGDLAIQYPVSLLLGPSDQVRKWQDKIEDQLAFIVSHSQDLFSLVGSSESPGSLYALVKDSSLDIYKVLGKAGSFCLRAGRESQAIQLFHAGKQPQKVVDLLAKRGKKLLLVGCEHIGEIDQFTKQA